MHASIEAAAIEERATLVACFVASHPAEVVLHALSLRLAKQCRERIQHHLPEAEWRDCDEQFYQAIRAGFADLWAARTVPAANVAPRKP